MLEYKQCISNRYILSWTTQITPTLTSQKSGFHLNSGPQCTFFHITSKHLSPCEWYFLESHYIKLCMFYMLPQRTAYFNAHTSHQEILDLPVLLYLPFIDNLPSEQNWKEILSDFNTGRKPAAGANCYKIWNPINFLSCVQKDIALYRWYRYIQISLGKKLQTLFSE